MIGNVPGDFYLFDLYEKLFINMIWSAGLLWQATENIWRSLSLVFRVPFLCVG